MKRAKSWGVVVGLLAVLTCTVPPGCKQSSSETNPLGVAAIDQARLEREIAKRAEKAAESKAVSEQLDTLITTIGEAPEVAKAGEALLEAIGSAPQLQDPFSKITTALGESPVVQEALKKLRSDNPTMSEEQLVAAFVQRVETNTDSPAFDKGFDTEFDKLMKEPEVDRVIEKFGAQVAESPHLEKAIEESIKGQLTDRELTKRLTKLNGGKEPDAQRATDLLLEHVFTEKRFEKFYVEVFGLPAARKHIQQAAAELLAAPSVKTHMITAVSTLFADPTFRQDALSGVILLMGESLTEAEVATAVGKLTAHPVTKKALVTLVDGLLNDPALKRVGDK
ncbi:MAG: hypothetical protein JRI68_31280, partial [Deltaproteobacteria bacterium]|nr:hypothetical protein [Deltaproteobacteria bacterium]